MKDNYKQNIEALKEKNIIHIQNFIENAEDIEWVKLIRSDNGDLNLLVKENNKVYPAYDNKNPRTQLRKIVKNMVLEDQDATVIVGAGCGHLLKLLLDKKKKKHVVILIEPIAIILKYMFRVYDFSKWITDGTLIIIDNNVNAVSEVLSYVDNTHVTENWILIAEKYATLKKDYQKQVEQAQKTINQIRCNVGTIIGAGAQIAYNDIDNIPWCLLHPGVIELKDVHKNKPAVIISTGPSLKKNLHFLIENKNNVIIIAVAQALRMLLAYGIKPDFIVTVDYGKVNYEHFDGLFDVDIPLVALNRTYAPILKKWQGQKYIIANKQVQYEDEATSIMGEKGEIVSGGSVSHAALGLAVHMGCDPVMITGQDLSYETDNSHIAGADASGKIIVENGEIKWKVTDQRSTLKDGSYSMGPAQYVPGYLGKSVLTNLGLASFITAFESIVKMFPDILIINATEGGAKIKGAFHTTLKNALFIYAQKKIDKKIQKKKIKFEELEINKMLSALRSDLLNLLELKFIAVKALKINSEITRTKDKNKLKKLLAENELYSNQAHDCAKKNSLVGVAIFSASRAIYTKEYQHKKNVLEDEEQLKIGIKKNRMILEKAKSETMILLKKYNKTIKTLEMYLDRKISLTEKKMKQVNFKDTYTYIKNGNWIHPYVDAIREIKRKGPKLLEAKKVFKNTVKYKKESIKKMKEEYVDIQDRLTYNDYIEKAMKLGNKKLFEDALNLLKKALKLFPEKAAARWGYATTLYELGKVDESLFQYEVLMNREPENLTYKYEYGHVMLLRDVQTGLKIIGEVLSKTNQFDNCLINVGMLYEKAGMHQEAKEAFENYLKIYPENFNCWEILADVYKKLGDKKNMAAALTTAKKLTRGTK